MTPGRRWRDTIGIVVVLAALSLGTSQGAWFWRLDRLLYDLSLSLWQQPPPSDIVIVAIDDASIAAIGRWPWPRAVHATALQQLAQARPKAVALDLVLSEPDPDPRQDGLLAQALQAAGPVVLPLPWQRAPDGSLQPLWPVAPIAQVVRLGLADVPVDPDGVLRHAFLDASFRGRSLPYLATALLQAGGDKVSDGLRTSGSGGVLPAPSDRGAVWRDHRFLVRFGGPPGWVPRVSYVDLLQGLVPAAQLQGRYVLVGMTAQGLGDTLATPVNQRQQAMPGVEVLAQTLHTLRSARPLNEVAPAVAAAGSVLALALLVGGLGRCRPGFAMPLALGSVPLALGASVLSLKLGWWWSAMPYALPALLAYPLWSWRRLAHTMQVLQTEIRRLAASARPDTAPPLPVDRGTLEERLALLHQVGDELRHARRFLAASLAALPTATLVADGAGRVLLANARAAALFDVAAAADLEGLDLARLLGEFQTRPAWQVGDWAARLAALRDDAPGLAVAARMAPEGDYMVHAAAMTVASQRRLLVSVADIQAVRQAQRQREEALAFVSHDLRAPAQGIVMLVDLRRQGADSRPTDSLLDEIHRLAARTLALSEDFVRAAQADAGPLNRRPVALADLLREALADHQAHAQAAQVALRVEIVDDTPGRLLDLDPALVVRALGNLVSNALRHSPAGATVEVRGAHRQGQLSLRVRDQGPGLSDVQLGQLAQGEEGAAVADRQGVGLGLLFVQRVARRHQGRLVASRPTDGAGACFELLLPQP